jgi:hypothetical protein
MFLNCSTCFERNNAHHQELKNCNCTKNRYTVSFLHVSAFPWCHYQENPTLTQVASTTFTFGFRFTEQQAIYSNSSFVYLLWSFDAFRSNFRRGIKSLNILGEEITERSQNPLYSSTDDCRAYKH